MGEPVASDDEIMARFVRDYLALLDDRVSRIASTLEAGDDMNAHVALLSLESTSFMVGQTELAKLVGLLRSDLEGGRRANMSALIRAVTIEAGQVQARLSVAQSR